MLVSSEGDSFDNLFIWYSSKDALKKANWNDLLVPASCYKDEKKEI